MGITKNKIKTIFMGTPDFAVPSLRVLIKDEQFDIVGVITQPDKKIGRKQIVTPPPVKIEALKNKIPIFQSDKILNLKFEILNLKSDIIVVVAYAQKLPKKILDLPKFGCINVHASLLPKYRGAACIHAAIMNGDKETGITIIKMDKGLDTGPILAQKTLQISPEDTGGSLFEKLAQLGAKILIPTLKKYIDGQIKPIAQNNLKASYVGLLKKEDGKIDWKKTASELGRFIRAMNPWPSAFTEFRIKNLELRIIKVLEVEYEPLKINRYKIGEIFLHNGKIAVQCGKDALVIKKLQLEGKKITTSEEFSRGHKELIGEILT
jgi:methionyl-tRNA formyltransferase